MQTIIFTVIKTLFAQTNKSDCSWRPFIREEVQTDRLATCDAFFGHYTDSTQTDPHSLVHSLNAQLHVSEIGLNYWNNHSTPFACCLKNGTIDNQIVLSFSLCKMICYFIILLKPSLECCCQGERFSTAWKTEVQHSKWTYFHLLVETSAQSPSPCSLSHLTTHHLDWPCSISHRIDWSSLVIDVAQRYDDGDVWIMSMSSSSQGNGMRVNQLDWWLCRACRTQ